MHAAPARYVSVSELYSADEVELLLDEIRELEPTSCRGEDVQDFEIAGSGLGGCGGGGGGGVAGAAGGGRSPCGTELTERSWDSHAHYSRAPPPRPRRIAPLYCRASHLATLHGATALLILLCSISACGCVWSLVGVRSWLLPLSSRIRLLALAAFSSALMQGALVFAHVSRLAALLPVDWARLAALCCAWSGAALAAGAALTAHAVLLAPEYRYAPPHVVSLLLTASGLCAVGAGAACAVVGVWARACYSRAADRYRAVPTAPPPPPPPPATPPPATPPPARPGTSRQEPL